MACCLLQDIQQYLLLESRKEAEVVNVRLENIKLKNRLKKEEQKLRSKVCDSSPIMAPAFILLS